jgi:hypothetical protein
VPDAIERAAGTPAVDDNRRVRHLHTYQVIALDRRSTIQSKGPTLPSTNTHLTNRETIGKYAEELEVLGVEIRDQGLVALGDRVDQIGFQLGRLVAG